MLLQEFDDEKLLEWINYEIEGYPSIDNLPEYRKIGGQLYGTYYKGSMASHMTYNHVPLPLGDMPQDDIKVLLTTNMSQGIEALKSMIMESEKGIIEGYQKLYQQIIIQLSRRIIMILI